MLTDGIRYPKRGEWVGRTLIGGLLSIFGFLIIPALLLYGYYLRVLGSVASGVEEPPDWDDWGTLLVRGLIAALIAIAYTLPLLVFSALMAPLVGVGALSDDPVAAITGVGLLWAGGVFVLGILVAVFLPVALTRYAVTNEAAAAFELGTVVSIGLSGDYLVAVVVALVAAVLLGILSGIAALTIIGIVLVPFIGFYTSVAVASILATGVRRAGGA